MGINFILPLIAGIVMTVIIGSQVAPNYIEQMKIAKVENRTISNQNLIKDAIVRYIKLNGNVPDAKKGLDDLKHSGLLKDYHESNFFNGGYSFDIDKKKGTLKIFTTIKADNASAYFTNSVKFPNKPICTQNEKDPKSYDCETFYLLDDDTFASIPPPPPEIKTDADGLVERFTEENLGVKVDKEGNDTIIGVGEKDYVVQNNNDGTYTIIEKEKQVDGTFIEKKRETIASKFIGKDSGVEIKNVTWKFVDGLGKTIEQTHEKVVCNKNSLDKKVFVVNQNTGKGEIIWVAHNFNYVTINIFGSNQENIMKNANNIIGDGIKYIPNNICMSNIKYVRDVFKNASNFNQNLNRWDTINFDNIYGLFHNASAFNNGCDAGVKSCPLNWNTSSITIMINVFREVSAFDQPLDNWDVSNVTAIGNIFDGAKVFNQNINNWNVSKINNMLYMFYNASKFNQPLDNWNVSNVIYMFGTFWNASKFNQDISKWDVDNVTDRTYFSNNSPINNTPFMPKFK